MVVVCLQSGDGGSKGHVSWLTIPHHHHHCPVAGEGHCVIPPPYPRLTASLQWDGRNRFVAGGATRSVDDQVGDATCSQEVS